MRLGDTAKDAKQPNRRLSCLLRADRIRTHKRIVPKEYRKHKTSTMLGEEADPLAEAAWSHERALRGWRDLGPREKRARSTHKLKRISSPTTEPFRSRG